MCGIAGICKFDGPITPEDVAAVQRMMNAQVHRGPDEAGLYEDRHVVLGSRRLAILDLSPSGHQPMANEDRTVHVTYNGEIYNFQDLRDDLVRRGHRFRSRTDTEVLVHGYEEWGTEGLLERLRGMFAFVLLDLGLNPQSAFRNPKLFLARDRLGIKPLYYYQGPDYLVFASEVKALRQSGLVPQEPDRDALAGFLLLGSVPAPQTILRGVRSLMPGQYLAAEGERVILRRYWDLARLPGFSDGKGTVEEVRTVLEDAVARHLVSDVPLGVFLSGGLDSAGLVALASRARRSPLVTLTVVFPEEAFSEAREARQTAEYFGTEHREVLLAEKEFMEELPRFFAAMDQPTNDGVNTYFIAKAAHEAGLTVVLSGMGGDELFWVYRHYRWLNGYAGLLRRFSHLPGFVRRTLVRAASTYGRLIGQERWMRAEYLTDCSVPALYLLARGFFAPQQVQELCDLSQAELKSVLARVFEATDLAPDASSKPAMQRGNPHNSAIGAFNVVEMQRYLHDQLLRDTDVFSMAHSIEVRVPYLDHRVVELVLGLPAEAKLDSALNKPLLVHAIQEPLLVEIARRKKQTFTLPLETWLKRRSRELGEMAAETQVLNREAVQGLWRAFEDGRLHWSRAWALVVLGAMHRSIQ